MLPNGGSNSNFSGLCVLQGCGRVLLIYPRFSNRGFDPLGVLNPCQEGSRRTRGLPMPQNACQSCLRIVTETGSACFKALTDILSGSAGHGFAVPQKAGLTVEVIICSFQHLQARGVLVVLQGEVDATGCRMRRKVAFQHICPPLHQECS